LFIAVFVILCLGIRDELPIVNRSYKATNSLPIPVIILPLTVKFRIPQARNQDCTNFVNKAAFVASTSKYAASFVPNYSANSFTRFTLTINITDSRYNISNQDDYMEMHAYDHEYDSKPLQTKAQIEFEESLLLKNMYFFGQPRNDVAHYEWVFDRCIRHALITDVLSYFGRQRYINIPYIESHMSTVATANSDTRTSDTYAILQFLLYPPFIVMEETEERSKTILNLLGVAGGIWGVIAAFYILLFGPGLISPWGFVQRSKLYRNHYEKNILPSVDESDSTEKFNSPMEKRLF
ncbi:36535_t:CDS:10, partial [Racocetra persica]